MKVKQHDISLMNCTNIAYWIIGFWTFFAVYAHADNLSSASNNPVPQLRDPTQPPMEESQSSFRPFEPQNFHLSTIMYSSDESFAIINEQFVKVGSLIHGAEVIAIFPDRVLISKDNQTLTLRIVEERIRQ